MDPLLRKTNIKTRIRRFVFFAYQSCAIFDYDRARNNYAVSLTTSLSVSSRFLVSRSFSEFLWRIFLKRESFVAEHVQHSYLSWVVHTTILFYITDACTNIKTRHEISLLLFTNTTKSRCVTFFRLSIRFVRVLTYTFDVRDRRRIFLPLALSFSFPFSQSLYITLSLSLAHYVHIYCIYLLRLYFCRSPCARGIRNGTLNGESAGPN